MRGSPGQLTEALMQAATTDAEREEATKAKDEKEAKKDEQEAKKAAKRDSVQAEIVVPVEGDLVVGNIVLTSAKKDKLRFDNFKAEVMSIKKDKVRVKFLDGPALGVSKDMQRNCVTLVADIVDEVAEESNANAKRQRLADDLFGPML
jgi:sRNA-binding protein